MLTFEAVNGEHVNTHALRRLVMVISEKSVYLALRSYLSVSNSRAFMEHDATILFEVLDELLGCRRQG